jgi:hypothetical protein
LSINQGEKSYLLLTDIKQDHLGKRRRKRRSTGASWHGGAHCEKMTQESKVWSMMYAPSRFQQNTGWFFHGLEFVEGPAIKAVIS